jgi:uncharacterized membrane protein
MDLGHVGWVMLLVGTIVLCTFAIAASLWVLHSLMSDPPLGETAMDALDGSLARGEISADEYHERRDALAP